MYFLKDTEMIFLAEGMVGMWYGYQILYIGKLFNFDEEGDNRESEMKIFQYLWSI